MKPVNSYIGTAVARLNCHGPPQRAIQTGIRLIRRAPHAEEHSCRPSRPALRALLRMRQLCVSKHARRLVGPVGPSRDMDVGKSELV